MSKEDTTARYKMIFLALLESAMRYRDAYEQEELEIYSSQLINDVDKHISEKKLNGTRERKISEKVRGAVLNKKLELEKFSSMAHKEIGVVRKTFNNNIDDIFDRYATGFGLMIEHYLNAKNGGDLLALCNAYNKGLLDDVIAAMKTPESNPETKE
jgi:hypothetical protein